MHLLQVVLHEPVSPLLEGPSHQLRQRFLAHKTRKVLDKVPDSTQVEVQAMLQAAYRATNQGWPA